VKSRFQAGGIVRGETVPQFPDAAERGDVGVSRVGLDGLDGAGIVGGYGDGGVERWAATEAVQRDDLRRHRHLFAPSLCAELLRHDTGSHAGQEPGRHRARRQRAEEASRASRAKRSGRLWERRAQTRVFAPGVCYATPGATADSRTLRALFTLGRRRRNVQSLRPGRQFLHRRYVRKRTRLAVHSCG